MANQNARPIAPARKLIAAVLGTVAVFVVLFGVGLASWAIVVLGLVMLGLSITLALVNIARRGARAWVAGTAQVKAVSDPPVSSRYGRAELQLVVVAPGLPVTEVLAREPRVPVEKWPRPGVTLPVQVDVDDMRRVRVDWATAPDNAEPPPPGHSYDTAYDAAYPDPQEEFDDDLLGGTEPPPWATASRDWDRAPEEPPLPPPPGPVIDHGPMADPRNKPVIVHDTPAGAVVEGQLVDQRQSGPLPRRPTRSAPIPSPSPSPDVLEDPPPPPPSSPSAPPATETPAASGPEESVQSAPAQSTAPRRPGSRPSPHPRRPTSAESAEASAEMGATTATVPGPSPQTPPAQRSYVDSAPAADPVSEAEPAPAPDDAPPSGQGRSIDIPLDDFVRSAAARRNRETTAGSYAVMPEATPATSPYAAEAHAAAPHPGSGPTAIPDHTDATASAYNLAPDAQPSPEPQPTAVPDDTGAHATASQSGFDSGSRAEPRPASSGPVAPEPVAPEPVAPEPVAPAPVAPEPLTPPPTAPEPVSGPVGAAPTEAAEPRDPEIDLPLDGDPEPPPETRPDAKRAVAAGIMAPPAEASDEAGPAPMTAASAAGAVGPWTIGSPATAGTPAGDAAATPSPPPVDSPATDAAAAAGTTWADTTATGAPAAADTTAAGAPAAADTTATDAAAATGTPGTDTAATATAVGRATAPPAAMPSPVPEVPLGEPPVVTGIDQLPAGDQPRGQWADLEGGYNPDERTSDVITAYPSARPGPAAAIHGVGILVLVSNLERSVAFYRDVLGFFVIDSGPGSAVLASGDTRVVLRIVHELSPDTPRVIYLNLEVGDIEAVHEELKAKGVEFVHAPRLVNRGEKLELWSATFMDPDRHNIAISQWRAATRETPRG